MKKLFFLLVIGWGCATAAWSATPGPLTTLHAIRELSNEEAAHALPVEFEGTVTYFNRETNRLYVEQEGQAVFVRPPITVPLLPGDRVLVRGTTQQSFLPYVVGSSITLLHHGALPAPLPVGFDDLTSTRVNCMLVVVHGFIRTADLVSSPTESIGRIQLLMDGGYIDVDVDSREVAGLRKLLDAEVEVTGTAARTFDGKLQQTGVAVRTASISDIRVLHRADAEPWSVPITGLGEIISGIHVRDLSQRLHLHGTITYFQPGFAVVLQDGARSLWLSTETNDDLKIGDVAEATGFPDSREHRLTLTHAEIRDTHVRSTIQPFAGNWHQLAFWGRSNLGGHQFDLVSIEGRVVTEVREATQDEYVLTAEGKLFTAIYRHPPPSIPLPLMPMLPLQSLVRVTGICMMVDSNPVNEEAPFNILLRSFDDLAVVAGPPLLNIRNLTIIAGLLLMLAIGAGIRAWIIERRLRQKTAALAQRIEAEAALERRSAQLEQQRSRILEDINGSRPLAEILEEITKLVSFQLNGAPCWCQIAHGARLGDAPPDSKHLRIVCQKISAHGGPPLGVLSAALDLQTTPSTDETEALTTSARLAALAIETRRLYSDLLRRSEFDLLTDIHNRFSLEKNLDAQIEEARFRAGIFGLIYIDLDRFKQINDVYGHHIGDLYLQEVALRMKRQLRPHDTLARLGGDEFAVLVPVVRSRAEVEEIAQRLSHCFDEPFAIERLSLQGAASIGLALYPEDGASRDSLLNAADVAMYAIKNNKKRLEKDILPAR